MTLVFSVIGKLIPNAVSQKFLISLFDPGSCLKLSDGTPITINPLFLYVVDNF